MKPRVGVCWSRAWRSPLRRSRSPAGARGIAWRTPTLEAVPGPGAVSYGENIAYTASFSNDGSSTFSHMTFTMAPPVIPSDR